MISSFFSWFARVHGTGPFTAKHMHGFVQAASPDWSRVAHGKVYYTMILIKRNKLFIISSCSRQRTPSLYIIWLQWFYSCLHSATVFFRQIFSLFIIIIVIITIIVSIIIFQMRYRITLLFI